MVYILPMYQHQLQLWQYQSLIFVLRCSSSYICKQWQDTNLMQIRQKSKATSLQGTLSNAQKMPVTTRGERVEFNFNIVFWKLLQGPVPLTPKLSKNGNKKGPLSAVEVRLLANASILVLCMLGRCIAYILTLGARLKVRYCYVTTVLKYQYTYNVAHRFNNSLRIFVWCVFIDQPYSSTRK